MWRNCVGCTCAGRKNVQANLKRNIGVHAVVKSFTLSDSKAHAGTQLADLLLGATAAAWHNETTSVHNLRVARRIAMHLGWTDLRADRWPSESKYNVWYFHDPTRGAREVETREVKLLLPMTPFRRRSKRGE